MKRRPFALRIVLALVLALLVQPLSPSQSQARLATWDEVIAGFFSIACKGMGGMSRADAEVIILQERQKYPLGAPITLYFTASGVVSKDPGMSDFNCLLTFVPSGVEFGHGKTQITKTPSAGTWTVIYETSGLAKDIPEARLDKFWIAPVKKDIAACALAGFQAKATYKWGDKTYEVDLTRKGAQWTTSDPSGLSPVSGSADPGTLRAAGGGDTIFFQGRREGTYQVTASLGHVTAGDVAAAALAGNPLAAQQLAQQLARSSASATVVVGKPTVSYVGVFPTFREISPGEKIAYTAQAAFAESCIQARDVTSEATWTPAGSATYVAPPLKPTSLKLASDSHPSLEAEACDTAHFSATLYYTARDDIITATYGGKKGEAKVRVKAPQPKTADSSVAWSSPSGGASFLVKQTEPITVKVTHGDSGAWATAVLKVNKPTIARLTVKPSQATLDVSGQQQFSAWAQYDQSCLEPTALSSTGGLSWSTGSHGSVSPNGLFEASVPGTDTVIAALAGVSSGQAAIKVRTPALGIVPSSASLTLGEEQSFRAMLHPYTDVTHRDATVWKSGPVFKAESCGTFPVSATFTDPETSEVRSDSANVSVSVDKSECVAIREALAASLSPDHLSESKKWLTRRQELIDMGCGNCGVEPTWTSGESETEVLNPEGDDVQPQGCSDPRRRTVKRVSTDGEEFYTCGFCKSGFIPIRSGDGQLSCETGDEIASAASCPAGTSGRFDPSSGNVGCCPPNTYWNTSQNTCEGLNQPPPGVDMTPILIGIIGAGIASSIHERDRRRRRPRGTPKKKCHKRPDGSWHCGSG